MNPQHRKVHDEHRSTAISWKFLFGCMALIAAVVAFLAANSASTQVHALKSAAVAQKNEKALPESPFASTATDKSPAPGPASEGMVWIPGGEFSMGSDAESESLCSLPGVTRDALPIHRVAVDGFWMDATEVTNEQYAKFVTATGYVTVAEQKPTQEEFPTAPPENLIAGSTVFAPTRQPVALNDYFQWWSYVPGADWKHPIWTVRCRRQYLGMDKRLVSPRLLRIAGC